jgi:hypothetical protein
MIKLGNELAETTIFVQKGIKKFIQTFNKAFEYVRIEIFIFEEADY